MTLGAVVDNVATAAAAIGAILSGILALKVFGPQSRKLNADTGGAQANQIMVMSEVEIKWRDQFEREAEYTDMLETTVDAWWEWRRAVQIIVDAACPNVKLPPPPAATKRPPRDK